jgi:DNA-directed RNA polymerase specialized sigma24 family protein
MDVPDPTDPTESRATFSATSASLVERLKADATDVTQEVFRAVSGAIEKFRRERPGDTFRGWLRVIARNKVRHHFRRNGQEAAATT